MSIGISLSAIAIGAILKFAVNASVAGINLATVGVIVLCVGVAGLVIGVGNLIMTRESADRSL